MPPSAHARTANTSLSFRGQQNNAVLQVKISKLKSVINLGAGMDLETGDRYEGVKKEGFIKKRNIRLMFSVTNIMILIDLKFTANKEKM